MHRNLKTPLQVTIILIFATLVNSPCLAGGLASFSFEGMQLGDSQNDFIHRHPEAKRIPATSEEPLMTEEIVIFRLYDTKADVARYYFFKGRLYQMILIYESATLNKAGGVSAFCNRLKAKLGQPLAAGDEMHVWKDSGYNATFFRVPCPGEWWSFIIRDTGVTNELKNINTRKAEQLDLGF